MPGAVAAESEQPEQPEFVMIRFFDYIKPGKKYIYRVRAILEDPNHPENSQLTPHQKTLDDAVRKRLMTIAATEQKTRRRMYFLTTDWSEISPPVSAPTTASSSTYAGSVELPGLLTIPLGGTSKRSGFTVPDGEPTAEVMSVSWDPKLAADVPAILKAKRGDLLNRMVTANVIDPVTLEFKRLENHPVNTGELVLDVRGGEDLPGSTDLDVLHAPGEVAALDATGNLIVRNELDDWETYDKFAPPVKTLIITKSREQDDGNSGFAPPVGF